MRIRPSSVGVRNDRLRQQFAQEPSLYGPIEMWNPGTGAIATGLSDATREIGDILASGDRERFEAMFDEVREYFGSFTDEALVQSAFLIDRLVERL